MLKQELIDKVARDTGQTKTVIRDVFEATRLAVSDAIAAGSSVMLFGLGKLDVARRGEKPARNLHTGAKVVVPPRNVLAFRASDSLVEAANLRSA